MIELLMGLGTSAGLGLGAGVNAYATFLVFGLLSRFYPAFFNTDLSVFFAQTPVLIVVGVLYAVEFVADKIPAVDHIWDLVHTVIRPLAGWLVALAATQPGLPKGMIVLAGVIGGGAALSSHLAKASVRSMSTVTTGGIGNPFLSIIEDFYAVLQVLAAIFLPLVVVFLIVLLFIPMGIYFARTRSRRFSPPRG